MFFLFHFFDLHGIPIVKLKVNCIEWHFNAVLIHGHAYSFKCMKCLIRIFVLDVRRFQRNIVYPCLCGQMLLVCHFLTIYLKNLVFLKRKCVLKWFHLNSPCFSETHLKSSEPTGSITGCLHFNILLLNLFLCFLATTALICPMSG